MNRFLLFVLFSVALHLAVGAALFSGTEMLGNKMAASSPNQANKEEIIDIAPNKPQQISTKPIPLKTPSPPTFKKKSKKTITPKKHNKLPAIKKVNRESPSVEKTTSKKNKIINTNNEIKDNKLNKENSLPAAPPNQQSIKKTKKGEETENDNDMDNDPKKEIKNQNTEKQEVDELIDEEDEIIEEPIKKEKNIPSNQEDDDTPMPDKSNLQKNNNTKSQNSDEITPTKQNNSAAISSNNNLPKASAALAARAYTQLKQKEGNPIPKYPKEARIQQWEGDVELVYYVNPVGFVENIYVNRSSGHKILDNEAIRTLSRYHYYPGQEGWVKHLVKFSLDKTSEIKETTSLRTLEHKQLE